MQATKLFGGVEKARAWLKHPQYGLGGVVPLDYATTETGAREVENLLGRVEYSAYSCCRLPGELFARHGSGAHLPAMEAGFTAVDGTHAGRRSVVRANMNLLQRWNYSSTSSRYLPPSDISRFDSNGKIN